MAGKMAHQFVINVLFKKESKGYSAVCQELGVASQEESLEEAKENIKEAVVLYLENAEKVGVMDEALEKLGLTREDLKNPVWQSKFLSASMPVEMIL